MNADRSIPDEYQPLSSPSDSRPLHDATGPANIQLGNHASIYMDADGSEFLGRNHFAGIDGVIRAASRRLTEDRLPPPDILGHLADRHVFRHDLEIICTKIRADWSRVCRVMCGDRLGTLYFAIEVDDWNRNLRQAHWPLGEWICSQYPKTSDFRFFFYGPMPDCPFTSQTQIFPKIVDPRQAA